MGGGLQSPHLEIEELQGPLSSPSTSHRSQVTLGHLRIPALSAVHVPLTPHRLLRLSLELQPHRQDAYGFWVFSL